MNGLETCVSTLASGTVGLAEDGAEHPLGVSALVSRLNCSSSGSDPSNQGSPEVERCGSEDQKEKNFPWLNSFSKQCRAAIGSRSMKQLDDLLSVYLEHVTPHYRDCHKLPNKAAKLKRNINDTMIFFHMLYMDIREPLENAFYYDKMTELMAMYLDLEITASRRGKDTEKTVTNKLSTSLYTFLDHSEDHILDALLKTRLINKHSKKVCVPLLRKVLSELVVRRPLAELTYVRFLLSFKLWKNVVADDEERKAINKLAAQRLHPPPEYFMDHEIVKPNAEVLPRVPKTKKNCTLFYLLAKFNVKDACRALFRYCKDTSRSNVYRRNMSSSEDMEKPFTISSRLTSDRNDVEEDGSCSLINDIWSTISNGDSGPSLLGDSPSDIFSDVNVEDKSDDYPPVPVKKESQPDSPDSRINHPDKIRRKDNKKKKEESVPDPKYEMLKTEGVIDPISAASPAKGVQDCCLGSVFMDQVAKVGGRQSHVKADPCEIELPTSSRQHSVLESLVYVPPGSDNEAVASSSVSPDGSSVPTSHLDTNECDSSVEILQSRQVSADVSLPLDLKPALNIGEDLRTGKAAKEELLLFEGDTVADDSGAFSPFADFTMFRLNDDIFNCRSFEGMDQSSMMYRRTDVAGSLPFQGTPLLEEDEDDLSSKFRWSSVPDFHPSVQSTIINQSSVTGSTADYSACYAGMDSKTMPGDNEEPKLGEDMKTMKGTTHQGMLWHPVVIGGKLRRIPSYMLARYKAAYLSRPVSANPPAPIPAPPLSDPSLVKNNVVAEASDNLSILAEQAVKVRDASVAEAKSKLDMASNLNLPLKKRKSLSKLMNFDSSSNQYQGINKSVIVMNSQYIWPTSQPTIPVGGAGSSNVSDNSAACNRPIDMSATRKIVNSQHDDASAVNRATKHTVALNSPVKHVGCGKAGCGGSCIMCRGGQFIQEHSEKSKTNGILKTRLVHGVSGSKCSKCYSVNCGGHCKPLNDGVKASKVTFQNDSTKTVLKCIQCNSFECNGVTCLSHCSSASSVVQKSSRSVPSKTTINKYCVCLSTNCSGRCYLTGRSTNNSLSTVSDFSALSSAFIDKRLKCIMCNGACCGKCRTAGTSTGSKQCPFCAVNVFNGNNLSHSMKSILGTSSKSKVEVAASTQKRSRAPSSTRRTRSSATATKQLASGTSNDGQAFSVEEVKRRKKNPTKSVAR